MESPLEDLLGLLTHSPGSDSQVQSSSPKEHDTPKGPRKATPTYPDDDQDTILLGVQGGASQTNPAKTHSVNLSLNQVNSLKAARQTHLLTIPGDSTPPPSQADIRLGGAAQAGPSTRPRVSTPPPSHMKGRLRWQVTVPEVTLYPLCRMRLSTRTGRKKIGMP